MKSESTAIPFVPEAEVPDSATLKVLFRPEEPGDRNYILGCWNEGWKDSPECRDLSGAKYRRKFQANVVGGDGVLWRPDTRVLVGCSPEDRKWVWCFCVFTPATRKEPPVIHWINVRPTLRDPGGGKRDIRRIGVATRMLGLGRGADGGVLGPDVKDKLLYTCRPGRQTSHATGEAWEVWGHLVAALLRIGIASDYEPLDKWLERKRGGR